jgi:ribose transport system substrate-binding protein
MIAKSSANFVFIAAQRGAEDTAREITQKQGVKVEIEWLTPPKEDAAVQAEKIGEAVAHGDQAILISCSDAGPLTPAINSAVDKGVAVMTFDSDAPSSRRFAFYGTDDGDIGEKVMGDLATLLDGKGKIAILAGSASAPNLRARADGVKKAAAGLKGIEVVDVVHHIETPQEAVAEIIRFDAAHPDLGGWAMIGGWPLFRSSQTPAFTQELERRHLKVVAVDGLPEELSYVDRDLVPVLWAQPVYLWGKVGVQTIVDHLVYGKAVPEKAHMDLVKVTKKNLGGWSRQLAAWGFTGLPDAFLKQQ